MLTGHKSAASFPTGPVIAEPFISPFGLTIYSHSSQLAYVPPIPQSTFTPGCPDPPQFCPPSPIPFPTNFTALPGVNTYHTGIILKVQVNTIGSPPRLGLPNDNRRHDLLPELGLSLLYGGHNHVTDTCGGKTIEACADTFNGNNIQVTGAGVVAAIHDGSAVCPGILVSRARWRVG